MMFHFQALSSDDIRQLDEDYNCTEDFVVNRDGQNPPDDTQSPQDGDEYSEASDEDSDSSSDVDRRTYPWLYFWGLDPRVDQRTVLDLFHLCRISIPIVQQLEGWYWLFGWFGWIWFQPSTK